MGLDNLTYKHYLASIVIYFIALGAGYYAYNFDYNNQISNSNTIAITQNSPMPTAKPAAKPSLEPVTYPASHIIPLRHHTFQRFNNCGPASLSMALSYFDVNISQVELGNDLRPYQVASGDNDDKSTTLEELADKAEELGFISYHRPNGNEEILKKFIANDIPVVTRTLTKPSEDIGHYRLVRGYTENSYIQDDSLQGKDLEYSINEFNKLWKTYNYEFLAFVRPEQKELAERILGENADHKTAWQNAVLNAKAQLADNPNDFNARFNLSVAYYNVGDYKSSVNEFEKIENQLTLRTLWYQIEPIQAYYELGNYDRVFALTDEILNNHNRAFSELYIIRGDIYKNQGQIELARSEYEKAVLYNSNLEAAQAALDSVS